MAKTKIEKAEEIHNLCLDYMKVVLENGKKEGELPKGELKTILDYLSSNGVNLAVEKKNGTRRLTDSLPNPLGVVNNVRSIK